MVFCGTPQFAVPSLQHLLQQPDFEVVGVFTQPDRPKGRGQEISLFTGKRSGARRRNCRCTSRRKSAHRKSKSNCARWPRTSSSSLPTARSFPRGCCTIPKFGWINLHASLLPKYRGAAPINWAIVKGETRTGNTTMRIDAGMDTGEILLQEEMAIGAGRNGAGAGSTPGRSRRAAHGEYAARAGGGHTSRASARQHCGNPGADLEARRRAN